ncbi:MAG: MmcB family DNA repair protein, partial [Alphaproteobacteria bacterium]
GAHTQKAPRVPAKAARRKALLTRFARTAAARLRRLTDPEAALT